MVDQETYGMVEGCNRGPMKNDARDGGGAMTEHHDMTVEAATTKAGKGLRMMNLVLMEPRKETAPTKRRRRTARRSSTVKPIGTIQNYFSKLVIPKECNDKNVMNGSNED